MASCKHCANGKHGKCVRKNAHKTTGCPGCCQHRGTKHEWQKPVTFAEIIKFYERLAFDV